MYYTNKWKSLTTRGHQSPYLIHGAVMKSLKLFSVSDRYISYLRNDCNIIGVYSNKEDNCKHTRKYLGVVIEISSFKYYIPLSSPKNTDYIEVNGCKQIRKSIIPIIRLTEINSSNLKVLLGTLRISHMIPVPDSELILYDLINEKDVKYKALVESEIRFIRKHRKQIINNATVLYNQKMHNKEIGYVKSALDYKALEQACRNYK